MEISEFDRFCGFCAFAFLRDFCIMCRARWLPRTAWHAPDPFCILLQQPHSVFGQKSTPFRCCSPGVSWTRWGKTYFWWTPIWWRGLWSSKKRTREVLDFAIKNSDFFIFILNLSRLPLYPPGCMSRARSPRLFKIRHVSTDFPELSIDMVFEGYFVFSELCSDYKLWTMTCDFFFNLFALFVILCLCSPYYTPGVEIIQGL